MAFKRSGVRFPSAPLVREIHHGFRRPGSGGGIGRRAGFRILWGQPREGSSPSPSMAVVRAATSSPLPDGSGAHVLELVDRLV